MMRVVLDTNILISSVLGGALAGNAKWIVSGDDHLLQLKTYQEIDIITAREFITQLENSK